MLRWRLILGVTLTLLLIGIGVADASMPGLWLGPLSLITALLASGEAVALSRASGLKPLAPLVHVGNLAIVASAWLPLVFRARFGFNTPLLLVTFPTLALVACVLVALLIEIIRFRTPGGIALQLAGTVWPLAYVGLLFSFLVIVRSLGPGADGIAFLLALVTVVKLGDTGAYTVGRLIGRHKLAPHLSPGKTIEGGIGGLAASALGGWLVLGWLGPRYAGIAPAPLWGALLFGVVVGAAGVVGDLAESLLKRDAGMKDSSRWMPGFGGVLDIVDSLLVAGPVAYVLLCW